MKYPFPKDYNKEISVANSLVNGYQYFCDFEHPLCNSSYFVYLHRHVASVKIGRWLTKEEYVHHIDRNKLNNSDENLLVTTNEEHPKIHAKIEGKNISVFVTCKNCKKEFKRKEITNIFCSNVCSRLYLEFEKRKVKIPTKEELIELINTKPWLEIGRLFNVSDNAARKWARRYNIKWAGRYPHLHVIN